MSIMKYWDWQWTLNLILISLVSCHLNSHEKASNIRKSDVDQEKGGINCRSSSVAKIVRGIELTCRKIVLSKTQISVWSEAVFVITLHKHLPSKNVWNMIALMSSLTGILCSSLNLVPDSSFQWLHVCLYLCASLHRSLLKRIYLLYNVMVT